MLLITFKVLLLAFTSLLQHTTAQDPCLPSTYRLLNDSWRSSAYESDASLYQCDVSLLERWYRPVSGAGVTMPTAAPDLKKCGTHYPIWMDDVLPATDDITNVKVCVSGVFSTCIQNWNIRVKKCSSFYVYELKQTSFCSAAYCFGSELPCPTGQQSTTGFTPGCGVGPEVTLNAAVTPGRRKTYEEVNKKNATIHAIEFQCNVEANSNVDLTAFVYDVEWYINDNKIMTHKNIPYANITESALRQSQWKDKFRLGFLVKCAVRVRDEPDGPPSLYSNSSDFYAGFTTDANQYTVSEGGSFNMTVRLTIPTDCMYPTSYTPDQIADFIDQCNIVIRVKVPTYYEDGRLKCTESGVTDEAVSFANSKCGISFPFNDWNTSRILQVFGSADNTVNIMDSRSIRVRLQADESTLSPAWGGATKPDIQVAVTDKDIDIVSKSCEVTTDPHLWTLDRWYISFQKLGEFILFKHETLPIRVHALFDWCHGARGTCTCGIAIRNQDAVFIINLCREIMGVPLTSGVSNTNRYIELRECDDTHMTVTFSGNTYTVILPSGTVITIQVILGNIQFIHSFRLIPSLADWKSTSGLCGILDGQWMNDMRTRDGKSTWDYEEFVRNWRLNTDLDGNSLFSVSGVLSDITLPPLQYCKCPVNPESQGFNVSPQVHCNTTSTITGCTKRTSSKGYFQQCDKARERWATHGYSRPYRSSSYEDYDIVKFNVVLAENYTQVTENYTWENGWTEALAEQSCREAIHDDPMLSKCRGVLPVMNDAIDEGMVNCINDIKISGDTGYLKDAMEALKSSCLIKARRFENLTTQGSENGNGATFLDELLELSCPNNCSENGNCTEGNCVCFTGFYGDECALELDTVPEILHGDMTCFTDKKSCRNFVISGVNFLDINLICQARLIKVYSDRWELLGEIVLFPATYLNSINCVCIIPDSVRKRRAADDVFGEGYLISISNDGINFSNETTIVTYDSTCYDCDASTIACTQLESCASTTTLTTTESASPSEQSTLTQPSSAGIAATKITTISSEFESSIGTLQTSATSTVTGTVTYQPLSEGAPSGTVTNQPSSEGAPSGTVTNQPSSEGAPSGTVTIPLMSTTTATKSLQNKIRNKEDGLPLETIIWGAVAGIVIILTITILLLCWKILKSKDITIRVSNAVTPPRELDNLPRRPVSTSGIRLA